LCAEKSCHSDLRALYEQVLTLRRSIEDLVNPAKTKAEQLAGEKARPK